MPQGVIYMYLNKVNGKIYIGKTIHETLRRRRHLYAASHPGTRNEGMAFVKAIRKYGIDAFEYYVLYRSPNFTDIEQLNSHLSEKEIFYIEQYGSYKKGYNLTKGGDGMAGIKMPDHVKRKLIESRKGRKISEEHKLAVSRATKKRWNAPGYREYMSKKMSGSGNHMYGVHLKGEQTGNYGKPMSEETKRKLSEAKKGKKMPPRTEEYKRKISQALSGKEKSEQHKQRLRDAFLGKPCLKKRKQVLQYSMDGVLLREWNGITEAEKSLGIRHISCCINGRRNNAGGYIWKMKSSEVSQSVDVQLPRNWRKIALISDNGDVIKTFTTIREASIELGVRYTGITEVLNGRQRKTHGLRFRYL